MNQPIFLMGWDSCFCCCSPVATKDVTPKPIFAVSDGPGLVADLVAKHLSSRGVPVEGGT